MAVWNCFYENLSANDLLILSPLSILISVLISALLLFFLFLLPSTRFQPQQFDGNKCVESNEGAGHKSFSVVNNGDHWWILASFVIKHFTASKLSARCIFNLRSSICALIAKHVSLISLCTFQICKLFFSFFVFSLNEKSRPKFSAYYSKLSPSFVSHWGINNSCLLQLVKVFIAHMLHKAKRKESS